MTVVVTHTTPADGTFSATGAAAWNADHAFTGTLDIINGGTGQITASAGFNALSPVTSIGDLIIGNGTNSSTRLAIGTNGYVLSSNGTTAIWTAAATGTVTSVSVTTVNGVSGTVANSTTTPAISLTLGDITPTSVALNGDTYLTRKAAANLRFGAADAASPVAQTLSAQSVVAGTTNRAGANLTITGSQGTGTGAGGSIVFQVAPAGITGTAQNALVDALIIDSTRKLTGYIDTNLFSANAVNINGSLYGSQAVGIGGNLLINMSNSATGLALSATMPLSWSPNSNVTNYSNLNGGDLRLYRDAANALAQRNGVNAQTKRLYGTYTDASNYRRLAMTMSAAGVAEIKPEGAGTGASGNVIYISGLPTSNPGPGILWNNAGTPAIGT